jgi:hypothetical protein
MAHEPGTMDIQQHKDTWANFVRLTIWVGGGAILVVAGLALFVY